MQLGTKYASIPNNEGWNHEVPSVPWSSPTWIECTPGKGFWTFEHLCSTQEVLLELYKGPYGKYVVMFAAVTHLEICFFFVFRDNSYLNVNFFLYKHSLGLQSVFAEPSAEQNLNLFYSIYLFCLSYYLCPVPAVFPGGNVSLLQLPRRSIKVHAVAPGI